MHDRVMEPFRSILNSFFCLDISGLPAERGDLDYDALGYDPDDTDPFGGEAA